MSLFTPCVHNDLKKTQDRVIFQSFMSFECVVLFFVFFLDIFLFVDDVNSYY